MYVRLYVLRWCEITDQSWSSFYLFLEDLYKQGLKAKRLLTKPQTVLPTDTSELRSQAAGQVNGSKLTQQAKRQASLLKAGKVAAVAPVKVAAAKCRFCTKPLPKGGLLSPKL